MKNILISLIIALIAVSCNKDIVSLELAEIIKPPEAPAIYDNSSVEPELRIKNTGTIDITSIAITYHIDVNNSGTGYSGGPTTTWFGLIKPDHDAVIILNKWESFADRVPLHNGTHMLFIDIFQVNTEQYNGFDLYENKRLFTLQVND